jgi:uncharacterized protein YndB with AHSA1/START domain
MWPYIVGGIALVILIIVVLAAMRPPEFRVSRTGTVAAPPDAVFPYINDMRKFQEWSPWAKIDPGCKYDFSEPASGKDAFFHWKGNSKVGEGRMTVTDSRPPEHVRFRLEFLRPFKATHAAEFNLKPDAAGTSVTWNMLGNNNFMCKLFGLFVNMDKMLGRDFERGLKNLNATVTGAPQA